MRELKGDVAGVDVYYLGTSPADIQPDDLVTDRPAAIGLYYQTKEYPRFRVALSDDIHIDASSAAAALGELVEFFEEVQPVEATVFLLAHGLPESDFRAWEKEHMAVPFMRNQGCDFLTDVSGNAMGP